VADGAPIHRLAIEVDDRLHGRSRSLELRVARHPSETREHLVLRCLAFALADRTDLAFSTGVCAGDRPPLGVTDARGRVRLWIEVGTPAASRLERIARRTDDLRLVTTDRHAERLRASRLRRPVAIVAVERALVAALAEALGRRAAWALTRTADRLRVETGGAIHEGAWEPLALGGAGR